MHALKSLAPASAMIAASLEKSSRLVDVYIKVWTPETLHQVHGWLYNLELMLRSTTAKHSSGLLHVSSKAYTVAQGLVAKDFESCDECSQCLMCVKYCICVNAGLLLDWGGRAGAVDSNASRVHQRAAVSACNRGRTIQGVEEEGASSICDTSGTLPDLSLSMWRSCMHDTIIAYTEYGLYNESSDMTCTHVEQ